MSTAGSSSRRPRGSPWNGVLSRFWNERLTLPGRYVVIGAVATGIAGSFPQQMVGSLSFSFFLALVLVCVGFATLRRPRVEVRRSIASRVMVGAAAPLRIDVTNTGPRTLRDAGAFEFRLPSGLKLEPDPQYVDRLEPGQTHAFLYTLTAKRRGSYLLGGATGLSVFPFGLAHAKRFTPQNQPLIVYPAFRSLRTLELGPGQSYQPGGVALASRVGESMEFIGNREYRPGDRLRDLHPRSWARRGFPVVVQREQEFLTRVAVLVDTWVPRLRSTRAMEANLSLAAAVSDWVSQRDYVVDLFAAGPELYHFTAGRSLAQLEDILEILACIEPSRADPLGVIGPEFARQLPQTTTVVALLLHWDRARREWVESVRSSGVGMKVVLVTGNRREAARARQQGVVTLSVAEAAAGVEAL